MTIVQAIFLGIIQGIAEFLPISSSGHLAAAEYFLGHTTVPIIFDVLLHIATLGAVCIVFYKTVFRLCKVLGRFIIRKHTLDDKDDLHLIAALCISTVVTGGIGILIKNIAHTKDIAFIAVGFIITGIVLLLSEKIQKKNTHAVPTILHAIVIGAAQGIGVLPGISRSGSTISAALITGLEREKAGEYSFLLSIPAIIAAFIVEIKSADSLAASVSVWALAAGMAAAFIVGLCSLLFLLKLIKQGKLSFFAYYLIPAGLLLGFWYA
ncbi:MAG: undecaprenyl-diphosphate phosphatase [Treponema sp.]